MAEHAVPRGVFLCVAWLLLGCLAAAPALGALAYICGIPALLILEVASRLVPHLNDRLVLVTGGGHGPPWPTGKALALIYFLPATVGFAWQMARAYRLHR